jgi:hypothetical protein
MAENKTKPTDVSPAAFIKQVPDERRQKDARELVAMMRELTGCAPKMWGPSIVGFGSYHYRYESGREGDAPLAGFSPRKGALVIYLAPGVDNRRLMAKLGRHTAGKACLYVKTLDDVDRQVLRALVKDSVAAMRKRHPAA